MSRRPTIVGDLVIKNLLQALHLAKEGHLDTYKLVGVNLVTHLVFINDVLCFTKGTTKSLHALRNIFHDFLELIDMQINREKSGIYLSSSFGGDRALMDILGFPLKQLSMKHLRIPLISRQLQNGIVKTFQRNYRLIQHDGQTNLCHMEIVFSWQIELYTIAYYIGFKDYTYREE